MADDPQVRRSRDPRWAPLRIVLGLAQMMGAIGTVVLLVGLGVHRVTIIGAIVTCTFTALSIFLFGGRRRSD